MKELTIREIANWAGGELIRGNEDEIVTGVSTDSREVKVHDIFFPIRGENHDAHKFLPQVYDRGCRNIIVADKKYCKEYGDCNVILVDDTTAAIQRMAKQYLKSLNIRTVAITGSVGKTSTRDMVYAVMQSKYKTGTAKGNFNSDIGVPLTIFTFDSDLDVAVLEVGMDQPGEIHRLVDIIRPEVAVITNVGISHIEKLGSRENIFKAKMEVCDFFDGSNTLVINSDNDMLKNVAPWDKCTMIRVGTSEDADFIIYDLEDYGEKGIRFKFSNRGEEYSAKLPVPGAHNSINSVLAIGVGKSMGIDVNTSIRALQNLNLTGKRLAVKEAGQIKILDDTYNASPESMKSAITTLCNSKGARRIAVLGGMNELGPDSEYYHKEVGAFAGESDVDLLIAIGDKGRRIAEGAREKNGNLEVMVFDSKEEFYPHIREIFHRGDIVVIKASRTLEFEKITKKIIEEQE